MNKSRLVKMILVVSSARTGREIARTPVDVVETKKRYRYVHGSATDWFDKATGRDLASDRFRSMYRYRLERPSGLLS